VSLTQSLTKKSMSYNLSEETSDISISDLIKQRDEEMADDKYEGISLDNTDIYDHSHEE
jgi:hypothetical protein